MLYVWVGSVKGSATSNVVEEEPVPLGQDGCAGVGVVNGPGESRRTLWDSVGWKRPP